MKTGYGMDSISYKKNWTGLTGYSGRTFSQFPEETKKTQCARGAQGLMAEKFTIIAKPKTKAIYSFLNMVMT